MPDGYPKITGSLPDSAPLRGRWVVSEKIHGANLSVTDDGRDVVPASRRGPLAPDALPAFFGADRCWPSLVHAVRTIRHELGAATATLVVELCGGAYPHPDVAPVPGASAVQTGVWYSPDVRPVLIDVRADGTWLAPSSLPSLAAAADLTARPVLCVGNRAEALAVPVAGATLLPALWGLPEIADNLREGVVIVADVTTPVGVPRPLMKCKRKEFAEDARYDGARPVLDADAIGGDLAHEAAMLLTPGRVAAARSKVGTDPVAAAALAADEVVTELAELVGGLDDARRERLRSSLLVAATSMARRC